MDSAELQSLLASTDAFRDWNVERLIGKGRFGSVFLIRREGRFGGTPEISALKWMRVCPTAEEIEHCPAQGLTPEDLADNYRKKIEDGIREIEIMRRLQGETNIVSYQDHEITGTPDRLGWNLFLRMERLTPVPEYIRRFGVSAELIVDVGRSIASALSLCHHPQTGSPIIHGDVKLSNVYYARSHTFKLGDFGLSFWTGQAGDETGGTNGYLAPECVSGGQKTVFSDQYALGVMLRELCGLLSRAPGEGKNCPPALQEIIRTATAENPRERYPDIDDMLEALKAVVDSSAERVRPWTAQEYENGAGRSGETQTDLMQKRAREEQEPAGEPIRETPGEERTPEAATASPQERIAPGFLRQMAEQRAEKRRKIVRRAAIAAALAAVLVIALIILLLPRGTEKAVYASAKYRLYRYDAAHWTGTGGGEQGDDPSWMGKASALSASPREGEGYVLAVEREPGEPALDLAGGECTVILSAEKAGTVRVSRSCEEEDSLLAQREGQSWFSVDLTPALRTMQEERALASGRSYRVECYLNGVLLLAIDGVFE